MDKPLNQYWLTEEESHLINIVRKIIWGEVQVKIRKGEIRMIKKVIESYLFERDNKKI